MSEVTTAEIQSFTEVLFKKYGLDFTCYEPQSLKRRIDRVLHVLKCSSIHELWSRMLKDKSLLSTFMDELSVGLTSMFREPQVWSMLRSIFYDYANTHSAINIWNAGCSTGEEIYTVTIVLSEMGLLDKVKISATDMNQTALSIAKNGIYHKIKMVDYAKKYKEYNKFSDFSKFYQVEDENHIKMHNDLIKNVNFKYHNLVTDTIFGKFDFIFCRNVMIYFDGAMKNRLLSKFYEHLNIGGYLIIGFYDSILPVEEKAKYNSDLSKLRIFKKIAQP